MAQNTRQTTSWLQQCAMIPTCCQVPFQGQSQQQACQNDIFATQYQERQERERQIPESLKMNNFQEDVFATSSFKPQLNKIQAMEERQESLSLEDIFATSLFKPQLNKIQAMEERQEIERQFRVSLMMNDPPDDVFAPENLKKIFMNERTMEERQERERQNLESQLGNNFKCQSGRGTTQQFPLLKITYIQIMQYAKANGSFVFPPYALNQLGLDQIEQNLSETIWPTIFALLFLEIKCSKNQATWQLVYSKGIQFLNQNGIDYLSKKNEYMLQYQVVLEKVE